MGGFRVIERAFKEAIATGQYGLPLSEVNARELVSEPELIENMEKVRIGISTLEL